MGTRRAARRGRVDPSCGRCSRSSGQSVSRIGTRHVPAGTRESVSITRCDAAGGISSGFGCFADFLFRDPDRWLHAAASSRASAAGDSAAWSCRPGRCGSTGCTCSGSSIGGCVDAPYDATGTHGCTDTANDAANRGRDCARSVRTEYNRAKCDPYPVRPVRAIPSGERAAGCCNTRKRSPSTGPSENTHAIGSTRRCTLAASTVRRTSSHRCTCRCTASTVRRTSSHRCTFRCAVG